MILNRHVIHHVTEYARDAYVILALVSRHFRDMYEQPGVEKETLYLYLTLSKDMTVWGHTSLNIPIKKLGEYAYDFNSLEWLISRGFRPTIETGKDSPSRRMQEWRSKQVFYSTKKQPSILIDPIIRGEFTLDTPYNRFLVNYPGMYQPSGIANVSRATEFHLCSSYLCSFRTEVQYIPIPPYKIVYPDRGICNCPDCHSEWKKNQGKSFRKHVAFSVPISSELFGEYSNTTNSNFNKFGFTILPPPFNDMFFTGAGPKREIIRVQLDVFITSVYREYLKLVCPATQ